MCIVATLIVCLICFLFRWVKHINDAADALKFRTKNSEPSVDETATPLATATAVPSAVATTINKESSIEGTPEKELSATAPSAAGDPITPLANSNQNSLNNNVGSTVSVEAPNGGPAAAAAVSATESNNNLNGACRGRPGSESDGAFDGAGDHNDDGHKLGGDDESGARNRRREYSNNTNNTRTLTQQSSLVAPSEVQVSVSPALTAEPVLTLTG